MDLDPERHLSLEQPDEEFVRLIPIRLLGRPVVLLALVVLISLVILVVGRRIVGAFVLVIFVLTGRGVVLFLLVRLLLLLVRLLLLLVVLRVRVGLRLRFFLVVGGEVLLVLLPLFLVALHAVECPLELLELLVAEDRVA